jgi:hypothetical protein
MTVFNLIKKEIMIKNIAEKYDRNRQKIKTNAEQLGLSPSFLSNQEQQTVVGPFVSPAPLSTTYAGMSENFQGSTDQSAQLANLLTQLGYSTEQALLVLIQMCEVPRKGFEASDALIVPKNIEENQKLSLIGKVLQGEVYQNVQISAEDLPTDRQLFDSFAWHVDRNQTYKKSVSKSQARETLAGLQSVVRTAFEKNEQMGTSSYLQFAGSLNQMLSQMSGESAPTKITSIDTEYYSPLITQGITEFAQFARNLESVGFFENNPAFLKVYDPAWKGGALKQLRFTRIEGANVILSFMDSSDEITFAELKQDFTNIYPCKELAYLLCFSSMVAAVYGDQNSGGYYAPYETACQQVAALGLEPIYYQIQPPISNGYQNIQTVYDFYISLANKKGTQI